jgi:hypothetical protein
VSVSGKYFRGRLGATVVVGLYEFTADEEGDRLDATDAESDGKGDTDVGVTQLRVRLRGNHKIGDGPWPGLSVGTQIEDLKLYLQSASGSPLTGPFWQLPSAVAVRASQPVSVRGKIEWEAEVDSEGGYSAPVGPGHQILTIADASGFPVVTTAAPHGLNTGTTNSVVISGTSGYDGPWDTLAGAGTATTFILIGSYVGDATGGTWA